jgi:ABC-type hemin transport system ATPase subunit
MDDVKIGLDFVSGYLKTERKHNEKEDKKKLALDGSEVPSSGEANFMDNLIGKLDPEHDAQKLRDDEKRIKDKEKQKLAFVEYNTSKASTFRIDDNKALSYLSNISPNKLQENSQILDEILEKLKNKE